MAEPHWTLNLLLGGLVGALVAGAPKVFANLRAYRYRQPITGTWNSYFFARKKGRMVLHAEKWQVTASLLRGIRITAWAPVEPRRRYSGVIRYELNQYYAVIRAHSHPSAVVIRFKREVDFNAHFVGIGLTYDFDLNPHASINVLSVDPLTESQVREIIALECSNDAKTGNLVLLPPQKKLPAAPRKAAQSEKAP